MKIDSLAVGYRTRGRVTRLVPYGAFVDLGGLTGMIHVSNLAHRRINDPGEVLKEGDFVDVVVVSVDKEKGRIGLSRKDALPDPWTTVHVGDRLRARVQNLAAFGAFVDLPQGLSGLVHVSELEWGRQVGHPKEVVAVGDEMDVVVIAVDRDKKRIDLSRKRAREDPWITLAKDEPAGTVLSKRRVRNVTDFGLFVEIVPGIDGLVHVTDISWEESTPTKEYQVGQEVDVVVLHIDAIAHRASLGIRQLTADPLQGWARSHGAGTILEGVVERVADLGSIIALAPGVRGTLPADETPGDARLKKGARVRVYVMDVDLRERHVSLSILAIDHPPGKEIPLGGEAVTNLGTLLAKVRR